MALNIRGGKLNWILLSPVLAIAGNLLIISMVFIPVYLHKWKGDGADFEGVGFLFAYLELMAGLPWVLAPHFISPRTFASSNVYIVYLIITSSLINTLLFGIFLEWSGRKSKTMQGQVARVWGKWEAGFTWVISLVIPVAYLYVILFW